MMDSYVPTLSIVWDHVSLANNCLFHDKLAETLPGVSISFNSPWTAKTLCRITFEHAEKPVLNKHVKENQHMFV